MEQLTLALVFDALAKAGALGAAALTIYALLTERLLPRGRLEEMRDMYEKRLAVKDEIIRRQGDLLEGHQRAAARRDRRREDPPRLRLPGGRP